MGLTGYLVVSALLFGIGAFGFLARRNAILMLICIELMLNAVNLSLVAFNAYLPDARATSAASSRCWSWPWRPPRRRSAWRW